MACAWKDILFAIIWINLVVSSTLAKPKNTTGNILLWEPPLELVKKFPYYITGYDYENRPVIVLEWGKWNIRKIVEAGGKTQEDYEKYSSQFIERLVTTTSPFNDSASGLIGICDAEGFTVDQLIHLPTLQFLIQEAQRYLVRLEPVTNKVIVINGNFAMESLFNAVKGFGGTLFDKIDIYGPSKSRWIPALLQLVPKDQLPPWYGGFKDYKPVQVYG